MARTSRQLRGMPLPCSREPARGLVERLITRLEVERSSGILFSVVFVSGLALVAELPEPTWAKLLYAALLLATSGLGVLYVVRKTRELAAARKLIADIGSASDEELREMCSRTLGELVDERLH